MVRKSENGKQKRRDQKRAKVVKKICPEILMQVFGSDVEKEKNNTSEASRKESDRGNRNNWKSNRERKEGEGSLVQNGKRDTEWEAWYRMGRVGGVVFC